MSDSISDKRRLAIAFFAAGGLALTVQVALLRDLMIDLQGDEAHRSKNWVSVIAPSIPRVR